MRILLAFVWTSVKKGKRRLSFGEKPITLVLPGFPMIKLDNDTRFYADTERKQIRDRNVGYKLGEDVKTLY